MADRPPRPDLGDDEVLLRALGQAVRDEPAAELEEPPEDVLQLAKAAWADDDLDVELAALLFDLTPPELLSGMRGETVELRSLAFEGAAVRIEVELDAVRGELLGQLEPAERATVDLHTTGGVRSTSTDQLGRFRFELPAGGLRIRVRRAAGPDLLTPWVSR